MAITPHGFSGVALDVDDTSTRALEIALRPHGYGQFGHYRASGGLVLDRPSAGQRIFELGNLKPNALVIITDLRCSLYQGTVSTSAQEIGVGAYKASTFTAVDTTQATQRTPTVQRFATMAPYDGLMFPIRQTVDGAIMTGGTMTLDPVPFANVATWAMTTLPLDPPYPVTERMVTRYEHPLVLQVNEALVLANLISVATAVYGAFYKLSWSVAARF